MFLRTKASTKWSVWSTTLSIKRHANFKHFQVKTHVQTACESPDLNMDFHSFDNGLKQLYEFMPEYQF